MYKNVSGQHITVFAWNTADDAPETAHAGSLTPYISKDSGALTTLTDTTATELSASNAPGVYWYDISQTETNADHVLVYVKSSDSDVKIEPVSVYTKISITTVSITNAIWDELVSSHTTIGTFGSKLQNATPSAATIQGECEDALETYKLDHLISAAAAEDEVADNSVIARLAATEGDWSEFNDENHSLEALRVRGDAAWVTGGGGAITQILNVQPVIPNNIDLANTATVRVGLVLTNAVDDLPSTAEITPGTIDIHRKAIGGTSWSSVVSGAAMSEQAGMVYYDEVFDSGTGYAEGDSIRVTFKSVAITADANDHEVCDANGVMFQTSIRQTMRGTDSGALASVCTEGRLSELDGANIPTDIAAVKTDTGNIETDTQDIQTQVGTAGAGLTNLGGMSDGMKAEVNAEADTALSDYDPPTKAELDSGLAGLNDLTAAEVNAEVDTALSDYDAPTNAEMTAAFTEIKGATWASGTDTLEHIRDKQTDIEADTNELQTDDVPGLISALNDISTAEVNAEVDTALSDYDPPTNAEMEARTLASASYFDPSADAVEILASGGTAGKNAEELIDDIFDETFAELSQGAPTSTPNLEEAIMLVYMALRNRVDVDTTGGTDYKEYYNDSNTVICKKAVSDDGSTYTETEMETGP